LAADPQDQEIKEAIKWRAMIKFMVRLRSRSLRPIISSTLTLISLDNEEMEEADEAEENHILGRSNVRIKKEFMQKREIMKRRSIEQGEKRRSKLTSSKGAFSFEEII